MKDCSSFYKLDVVLGFNSFKKFFFSKKKKKKLNDTVTLKKQTSESKE